MEKSKNIQTSDENQNNKSKEIEVFQVSDLDEANICYEWIKYNL